MLVSTTSLHSCMHAAQHVLACWHGIPVYTVLALASHIQGVQSILDRRCPSASMGMTSTPCPSGCCNRGSYAQTSSSLIALVRATQSACLWVWITVSLDAGVAGVAVLPTGAASHPQGSRSSPVKATLDHHGLASQAKHYLYMAQWVT